MVEARRKLSIAVWAWVAIAAMAIFELIAHPVIVAAVPSEASWAEAASFIRDRFEPGDRIVSAPRWADPIVRRELGDLLSLRAAAPPDEAGVDRVWELAIRGATTRDDPADVERVFGEVTVRSWPVIEPDLVYDFVERVSEARVSLGDQACPWTMASADPGGLERGPMRPSRRFVCDPQRPWLWVGATVLNDLDLEPRRCLWQHPAGQQPVRTVYADVPLEGRLVVHAGVDYQVARRRAHAPVTLGVFVDDVLVGELVHEDGDGWSTLEIDLSDPMKPRGTVRFETTTSDPTARLFCYAASIQTGDAT